MKTAYDQGLMCQENIVAKYSGEFWAQLFQYCLQHVYVSPCHVLQMVRHSLEWLPANKPSIHVKNVFGNLGTLVGSGIGLDWRIIMH
jgi:hypothetical protein